MDALASYGSDEDEDVSTPIAPISTSGPKTAIAAPTASRPAATISTSNASVVSSTSSSGSGANGGQKKTKKLDISFLPAAIQSALTRGDGLEDSDSEDEGAAASRAKAAAAAAAATGGSSTTKNKASVFLAALPKPKDGHGSAVFVESVPPSVPASSSGPHRVPSSNHHNEDEDDFNHGKGGPFTGTSEADNNIVDNNEDGDSEGVSVSPPPQPSVATAKSASAPSIPAPSSYIYPSSGYVSIPAIISAPIISAPIVSAPKVPEVVAAPSAQQRTSSYSAYAPQAAPTYQQQVPSVDVGSSPYPGAGQGAYYPAIPGNYASSSSSSYPSNSYAVGYQQPSAASTSSAAAEVKPSRKRERELQQALYSGDVSVIGNNANIVSVSAATTHYWDSSKYVDQQKREAEVNKMYGLTGSVAIPTKVQNRKHQINSLAVQAASAELDLLDAKSQRSKTKSQTQAKYGW